MKKITSKLILLEAFGMLAIARFLMLYVPFYRLAKMMGKHGEDSSYESNDKQYSTKQFLKQAIFRAKRKAWWKCECLVRALALAWMLRRRRMPYTIYLGVSKDENKKMIAHAWIRSGDFWMSGEEQREKFTIVAEFSYQPNKQ